MGGGGSPHTARTNQRKKRTTNSLPFPRVPRRWVSWLELQIWKKPKGHRVQAPSPDGRSSCSSEWGVRGIQSRPRGAQAAGPGPCAVGNPPCWCGFSFLRSKLSPVARVRADGKSRTKPRTLTRRQGQQAGIGSCTEVVVVKESHAASLSLSGRLPPPPPPSSSETGAEATCYPAPLSAGS